MTRAEQIADVAAAGTVVTVLGLSLAEWDIIVHIVAGCVAIVAGTSAAIYHIIRIKKLRQKDD